LNLGDGLFEGPFDCALEGDRCTGATHARSLKADLHQTTFLVDTDQFQPAAVALDHLADLRQDRFHLAGKALLVIGHGIPFEKVREKTDLESNRRSGLSNLEHSTQALIERQAGLKDIPGKWFSVAEQTVVPIVPILQK